MDGTFKVIKLNSLSALSVDYILAMLTSNYNNGVDQTEVAFRDLFNGFNLNVYLGDCRLCHILFDKDNYSLFMAS